MALILVRGKKVSKHTFFLQRYQHCPFPIKFRKAGYKNMTHITLVVVVHSYILVGIISAFLANRSLILYLPSMFNGKSNM